MKINYLINKEINVRDYLLSFYYSKSKIYKLFLNKQISVANKILKENDIFYPNDILFH